jgi:t-SNARE complex subunit (syntaxin)
MYKYEAVSEVEEKIIEETNREVKQIESDMIDISSIMLDLSSMIDVQGEYIDINVKNIEHANQEVTESVNLLEQSVEYSNKRKGMIKNVALIVGGISLGALGFLGGTIVGSITLISGLIGGSSIAFISNKLSN